MKLYLQIVFEAVGDAERGGEAGRGKLPGRRKATHKKKHELLCYRSKRAQHLISRLDCKNFVNKSLCQLHLLLVACVSQVGNFVQFSRGEVEISQKCVRQTTNSEWHKGIGCSMTMENRETALCLNSLKRREKMR